MKTTVATATLGLALILAGAPAFASAADMQTGPIQINTVRLYGGTSTDGNDSTTVLPGTAVISFTNQSAATATDVVFALETKGYIVDRFNDVGSFATGIPIKHTFPEAQPTDDMRVAVAEATFVDGTVWQNPDVVQSPQADATIGVAATRL